MRYSCQLKLHKTNKTNKRKTKQTHKMQQSIQWERWFLKYKRFSLGINKIEASALNLTHFLGVRSRLTVMFFVHILSLLSFHKIDEIYFRDFHVYHKFHEKGVFYFMHIRFNLWSIFGEKRFLSHRWVRTRVEWLKSSYDSVISVVDKDFFFYQWDPSSTTPMEKKGMDHNRVGRC